MCHIATLAYQGQTTNPLVSNGIPKFIESTIRASDNHEEFTSSGQEDMISKWVIMGIYKLTFSTPSDFSTGQHLPMSGETWRNIPIQPSKLKTFLATRAAQKKFGAPTWRRFEKLSERHPALWPSSGT